MSFGLLERTLFFFVITCINLTFCKEYIILLRVPTQSVSAREQLKIHLNKASNIPSWTLKFAYENLASLGIAGYSMSIDEEYWFMFTALPNIKSVEEVTNIEISKWKASSSTEYIPFTPNPLDAPTFMMDGKCTFTYEALSLVRREQLSLRYSFSPVRTMT